MNMQNNNITELDCSYKSNFFPFSVLMISFNSIVLFLNDIRYLNIPFAIKDMNKKRDALTYLPICIDDVIYLK